MLLEIFSHERLVREAHVLRYLLYALGRVLQQDTQLHHNVVVYPVVRSAAAHHLHRLRKILGGYAHLMGIPSNSSLRAVVLLYQTDKVREYGFGTRGLLVRPELYSVYGIAKVVNHGRYEHPDHITAERPAAVVNPILYHCEIVDHIFNLVGLKHEDRMTAREEKQRRLLMKALNNLMKEIVRHHDGYSLNIVAPLIVVNNLTFVYNHGLTCMHTLFYGVGSIAEAALQA